MENQRDIIPIKNDKYNYKNINFGKNGNKISNYKVNKFNNDVMCKIIDDS